MARGAAALALSIGLLLRPGLSTVPLLPVVPVAASCTNPVSLEDGLARAQVVFVGTVTYLENSNRWAVVTVEERWHGAHDLGPTVEVHGGADPGTQTPVDRTYELGRYLFAVDMGFGSGSGFAFLVDDACTATTPWTDALARLRPDGVAPAPGLAVAMPFADVNMDVVLPIAALSIALAIAVVAYLVILRARRRPPDWMR